MKTDDLMELYYNGDDSVLDMLYRQNVGYIHNIVTDISKRSGLKLSEDIQQDLEQVGALEFVECLCEKKFDPTVSKLQTYLYPFIFGKMWRYIEEYYGLINISHGTMTQIRKCKKLHSNGLSIEEIAKELNIKEKLVIECLNFTFRYEQLMVSFEDDPDEDQNSRVAPIGDNVSKRALQRVVYPMVRAEYDKLTTEQQHILGCYLGIFGFNKMPVSDIADMLMVTRNAVDKKITKALEKLYEYVWDSEIKYWINAYLALFKTNL